MPDWFYRTVSQRLLFALSPRAGRDLALGIMGGIAKLPGGKYVVDVLGHMNPDARLALDCAGLSFATPVGIGLGLDMRLAATRALSRFGAGLIEIGPIGRTLAEADIKRDAARATLTWRTPHCVTPADAIARLPARMPRTVNLLGRLLWDTSNVLAQQAALLSARVRAFAVEIPQQATPGDITDAMQALRQATPRPVFVTFPATLAPQVLLACASNALTAGAAGIHIDGALDTQQPGVRTFDSRTQPSVRAAVVALRAGLDAQCPIIASGGVHQPADALALYDAGADIVQVDSGLVFGGPGLIKRIDSALLARRLDAAHAATDAQEKYDVDPARAITTRSWFWLLLLALGMLFGSVLATWIALDHVLLPYDEVFIGLNRAQVHALNPHLLDFLTHDRITLAGLMMSLGIVFTGLAWNGARHGWHWAEGTIQASAIVGALTFFFFLGYGYFEPFHGFVTVVLSQFVLLSVRSHRDPPTRAPQPQLREDAIWRRGLWGQLCWIVFGAGLIGAGVVISLVGITRVFVPQDLAFMGVAPETLAAASPRLLPMIAHDRVTVGGMLISNGIAYACSALWGFQRGARWLWWTLVLGAIPAFTAAFWIHAHVGYLDPTHLAPLAPALALFAAGAGLCRSYLSRHPG
jgi:dihydroorotate dehydrogenase